MAKKKKEEDEPVKKEEVEAEPFDWTVSFEALECPRMFKAGLKEYIQSNELDIKSDKEFSKLVKDYSNLKIGD